MHLRVHSAYSLLEGALTIPKLVSLAAEERMPALALTDTNNLFGALEFSEYAAQAKIQPIVGCTLSLSFAAEPEARPDSGELVKHINHGRIALLAKDASGYANLIKLSTEAYRYGADSGEALVTIAHLALHQEGLIALTGGPDGVIDRAIAANDFRFAETALNQLKGIFGDRLYVELQRHGLAQERTIEPLLLDLAYDNHLPIVATNEPYFASPDDFEAHDALICIAEGSYVGVDQTAPPEPRASLQERAADD